MARDLDHPRRLRDGDGVEVGGLQASSVALGAVVFATAPVFIAADWGRHIAPWLTGTILWTWTVTHRQSPRLRPRLGFERGLLRVALLLAYDQTPDLGAVLPGVSFAATGISAPGTPSNRRGIGSVRPAPRLPRRVIGTVFI